MGSCCKILGILLCAGQSTRMGFDKLTTALCGRAPLLRSLDRLLAAGCTEIIAAVNENAHAFLEVYTEEYPLRLVAGGETRFASVRNALAVAQGDIAVIHDAARCIVGVKTVQDCIKSTLASGSGVAAIPMTDTVLRQEGEGFTPIPRESLWRMQTPQVFDLETIKAAYQNAGADASAYTDDASVWLAAGHPLFIVQGSAENRKLTTQADWDWAEFVLHKEQACTVFGTGYDMHILVPERKLIIGGVEIPFEKGLLGHSDADVLLHAISDAILGACALGDIGKHFSDTNPRYKDADSRDLLRHIKHMVQKRDKKLSHIDATILCQRPKLAPYILQMRQNIAADLDLSLEQISVKATTTEGMNDEGRGLCISAQAIATLR